MRTPHNTKIRFMAVADCWCIFVDCRYCPYIWSGIQPRSDLAASFLLDSQEDFLHAILQFRSVPTDAVYGGYFVLGNLSTLWSLGSSSDEATTYTAKSERRIASNAQGRFNIMEASRRGSQRILFCNSSRRIPRTLLFQVRSSF